MKQCPVCKTTYTDDSLSFCLSDGTSLLAIVDEEQTVVRNIPADQLRVDVSRNAEPTAVLPRDTETSGSSTIVPKIVVAAIAILILVIGGLGLAGTLIYYSAGRPTPLPPTPSPSPVEEITLDPERERLRDEIANIRRKLEEQERNEPSNNRPPGDDDDEDFDPMETATVNSPNDGFLALRTHPSTQVGDRRARIPHGARVEILDCNKAVVVVEGRRGRWCEIEYRGQVGWAFDAWLNY